MKRPVVSRVAVESIRNLLVRCGSLTPGERILILCDPRTREIASAFLEQAIGITDAVVLDEMPLAEEHGVEPGPDVSELMRRADLIVSLCTYSLAHAQARIVAGRSGARFLSLPLYTWSLLESPAVAFDFRSQATLVRAVADVLTAGESVHVTSRGGTDVTLDIRGRAGNCCPGFVDMPGDLGSPPDIEANISPLEKESHGVIVVDGSITCPEFGLLTEPVTLEVSDGRIDRIGCANHAHIDLLEAMFQERDSRRRILAECGIGLNPAAELTGSMLTDEGALGTMHFGFGSNSTVGGRNKIDFHLDFVFRHASMDVDETPVLREGEVVLCRD